jgi:hypothetical protein
LISNPIESIVFLYCSRTIEFHHPVHRGTVLSVSLLHKSSEPIRFRILLIPIRIPDTRIGLILRFDSRLRIDLSKQFQVFHVNFSFFTVLFTGQVKFGRESPILQAFGTPVLASALQIRRSYLWRPRATTLYRTSQYTSVLYSIYIFASVQSTTECTVLYCTSDRAASLKDLFLRSRANTV